MYLILILIWDLVWVNTPEFKIILLQSAKLLVLPLWEPMFYILAGIYKPAYIRAKING